MRLKITESLRIGELIIDTFSQNARTIVKNNYLFVHIFYRRKRDTRGRVNSMIRKPFFEGLDLLFRRLFPILYLLTSFWTCGKINAEKQHGKSSRIPLPGCFVALLGEKLQCSG